MRQLLLPKEKEVEKQILSPLNKERLEEFIK